MVNEQIPMEHPQVANGSTINGGHSEQENKNDREGPRTRKPAWRNIIENFSGAWFTIPMSTGVLGILFHNQPYQFTGLHIISTIMYLFTVVLFAVFVIPTLIRWTIFHEAAKRRTNGNLEEICMFAAAPIAWLNIAALTALCVSNAHWAGQSWSVVAVVFWWIGTVWMIVVVCGTYITIFHQSIADVQSISTAIFLPIVGIATAAATGALICRYGYDVSAGLAVPILIMSYFLDGLAIFLAIEMYSLYATRLTISGWPAPAKIPGQMLLVGPFGQAATALLVAGSAASSRMDFGHYNEGTFLTAMSGSSVSSACVLLAMLILGHDLFWVVIVFAGVGVNIMRRELTYSLLWWSMIFPLGTTTTAFIALSVALDSSTFRVLAAIFTIFLFILYVFNWVFTIWYSIKGDLLIKPDDDDEILEEKRE